MFSLDYIYKIEWQSLPVKPWGYSVYYYQSICSTYILILSNLGIPLYLKKKKDEKIEREIKQYESIRDF